MNLVEKAINDLNAMKGIVPATQRNVFLQSKLPEKEFLENFNALVNEGVLLEAENFLGDLVFKISRQPTHN